MAKRRGNGEGSVYRRKDGRVVGEWVDANGKRRYISGRTKTAVRRKLRELLADRDKGIAYDSENLTVGDYLDRWLDAVKGSVRPRTWQRSKEVVRLHLKPTIGHHRLEKLNAMQVQAVYGRKLEEGLSPRTVEIVHVTDGAPASRRTTWTVLYLRTPCACSRGKNSKKNSPRHSTTCGRRGTPNKGFGLLAPNHPRGHHLRSAESPPTSPRS